MHDGNITDQLSLTNWKNQQDINETLLYVFVYTTPFVKYTSKLKVCLFGCCMFSSHTFHDMIRPYPIFGDPPKVNPKKGLPFHQWWIEFDQEVSLEKIRKTEKELDGNLQSLNSYYKDLVQGKVLKPLEIVVVKKGGFKSYMESTGKLGGQNKLPRLSNDRKIADQLINYKA